MAHVCLCARAACKLELVLLLETTHMDIRRNVLSFAFIVFGLLSAACGTGKSHPPGPPTIEPALQKVWTLMLRPNEVPETWIASGEYYAQVMPGADALEQFPS